MSKNKTLRPPWKPGQSGIPSGRPIGASSRLTEKFILALHNDFHAHGRAEFEKVRKDQPGVYLKVIASLLQSESHVNIQQHFDGLSDELLRELIDSVRRTIASRARSSGGHRKQETNGGGGPDRVH